MQILTYNYAMKALDGSLGVSFKVIFCQINKIKCLLFLGIWDLNNYIWTLRSENLFKRKYFLRIMV